MTVWFDIHIIIQHELLAKRAFFKYVHTCSTHVTCFVKTVIVVSYFKQPIMINNKKTSITHDYVASVPPGSKIQNLTRPYH